MPESNIGAVNATPLIDVVLCMIVFFLIVGRLAETQRAPMQLPQSVSGEQETPPNSLVINIVPGEGPGSATRVIVDDDEVGYEGIEPALRARLARQPNVVVQIRAPRGSTYGLVEPALEACGRAGVPDVRLATERAEGGAS